jgi:hypothetical protein
MAREQRCFYSSYRLTVTSVEYVFATGPKNVHVFIFKYDLEASVCSIIPREKISDNITVKG